MVDRVNRAKRSEIMSRVRSKQCSSTELSVIADLTSSGLQFVLNPRDITGKPDIVIPSLKFAIFLDGCFWHGCDLHCRMPKTNSDYWKTKIATNKLRDSLVTTVLMINGWRVWRIWEHDIPHISIAKLLKPIIEGQADGTA
ncbi:very short patch repair endonuclease [Tepidiforma flava]|uniref:very short patch repair endonuclease n=1 Tax=Tepidiforma flava TaxID=3004094 RepID=UPI003570CAB1